MSTNSNSKELSKLLGLLEADLKTDEKQSHHVRNDALNRLARLHEEAKVEVTKAEVTIAEVNIAEVTLAEVTLAESTVTEVTKAEPTKPAVKEDFPPVGNDNPIGVQVFLAMMKSRK